MTHQRVKIPSHRPVTIDRSLRPSIVKEDDVTPPCLKCCIGYNLAMAAGTEERESSHGFLPVNLDIVASPDALIPSRTMTLRTVSHRIFRSTQKDRLSTYQTSNANLSSQLSALRPFTCAHPVTPGRISWRRACSGEYKGRYSINSGRGPTKLISPLSTFHNSGSSSKLVDRKNFPNPVRRSASGRSSPPGPRSSVIVRNLTI